MGLTRTDLFRALGAAKGPDPRIDKIVERAYDDLEQREWERAVRAPHGRAWHTSFHASAFPGGENELRCGRKALYSLMNVPGERFSPRSRAIMEQGRSTEKQIIYRLGVAGLTVGGAVSLDPDVEAVQLRLEDREHWLTGSLDAAMDLRKDLPWWEHVTPMDVKSKNNKGLIKLKLGEKEPEPGYVAQVMCYSHLCKLWHSEMGWQDLGLKPAHGGIIYYAARENPRDTFEVWVPWDQAYVDAGLARLKAWKKLFSEERLPERPKEWRWTEEPCKWCEVKKLCKQDIREDVEKLSESNAVKFARQRNAFYNPKKVIEQVHGAWKEAA